MSAAPPEQTPQVTPAATAPSPTARGGTKTFEFKFISAETVRRIFSGQAYTMEVDRDSNLLTVSGPPSVLNEIEATVKRFDVPPPVPKNVQVTIYLLGMTAKSPGAAPLPPEINGASPDLKQYSLLDSQAFRVRAGQSGDARNLEPPSDKIAGIARVRFRSVAILDADGKAVLTFDGLQIDLNVPGARTGLRPGGDSAIDADIDIPEKQAVIVGRAGQDKPLIVLVRGEIAG